MRNLPCRRDCIGIDRRQHAIASRQSDAYLILVRQGKKGSHANENNGMQRHAAPCPPEVVADETYKFEVAARN